VRLLIRFATLVLILFVVFFCVQNAGIITQSLDMQFRFIGGIHWERSIAVYELAALAVLVGLWLGGAFDMFLRARLKTQMRQKNRAIRDLEKELRALRNLPIEEARDDKRRAVDGGAGEIALGTGDALGARSSAK